MDFSRELMEVQGHGNYEPLDPALLPHVYVAYRTALSEGTEVFHNNVRERWRTGDPAIVDAMKTWASYAEQGRAALLARDYATLDRLINANFDLRAQTYPIGKGNLQMIHTARMAGATSNFAGSGGAIVGTYRDERMFQELAAAMKPLGVGVLKPDVTGKPRSANAAQCP
jgi:glucuronokinase